MPVWDQVPGNNPQAAGTVTFGVEGSPIGMSLDSGGNMSLAGDLTLTGGMDVAGLTSSSDLVLDNSALVLTRTAQTNIALANYGSTACLDASLALVTPGTTLRIAEGADAKMGAAVLVGGTVVVATAAVRTTSRIFLTCNDPGGVPGFLVVSARVDGVSFTILSSSVLDASTVAWLILDPA